VLAGLTRNPAEPQIAVARVNLDNPEPAPAAPQISIVGGVLTARGTFNNDTFGLRRTGTDDVIVTVNALSRTFDMDDFAGGVRLEGFGGNDTFNMIDPLNSPVARKVTVLGGSGNDTVSYATRTASIGFGVAPAGSSATSGGVTDTLDHVETMIGGSGNDTFAFGNLEDVPDEESDTIFTFRLEGRGGNDTFIDQLDFGPSVRRVSLMGGDGNDTFRLKDQGGLVFGEAGNDTINVLSREANYAGSVDGGSGIDVITGAGGNRNLLDLRQYPNVENAVLGAFAGTVIGSDLPNLIDGTDADDAVTINGLGGNDTLIGGSAADSLNGGEGNDTLIGNAGNDTLNGGNGTDFADGDGGQNTHISIEQFAGSTASIAIINRVLTAIGTGNADTITIERVLTDDVIVKVGSLARQFDMDDFDTVLLQGLGGNDTITIKQPITAGSLTRKVTLDGGGGNDALTGNAGDDVLRGGDGADTLVGLGGRDALAGNAGNDQLFGGLGLDFLDGGDNDDFIDSSDSAGGDTVLGGNGTDSADVDAGDSTSGVETLV
jgi:Ca2+-binding RTX toxin-like protein